MIQKTRKGLSGRANPELSRIDGPAVLMPSPHFDVSDDRAIFQFLDGACELISDRSTSFETTGRAIRQIYGVLRGKRMSSSRRVWNSFIDSCRQQRILQVMHNDEFSKRAFIKPRGYAGDAVLLDFIYGSEQFWAPPEMSWMGQRIHQWTTVCSACEGVKARRGIVADLLNQTANEVPHAHVLSLAAGHFRVAELASSIIRQQFARVVAIDSDAQSLRQIDDDYGQYGIETIHAAARELISGRFDLGSFDFIYSSGLFDYLNNSISQRLVARLFDRLTPGGKLLVTNFLEDIEAIGYMEAIMDWHLIYRNRMEMMDLVSRIPNRQIARASVFFESNYNVVFLMVERVK